MYEFEKKCGKIIVGTTISLFLFACGGSGGSSQSEVLTGVFEDSAVSNISYSTASRSGITNVNGEFNYQRGETVTFSIGDLVFPPVVGAQFVTPIEMASDYSTTNNITINTATLLQSLDADGVLTNGVQIPDGAHTIAVAKDLNVAPATFRADSDVINMIANSGSVTTTMVDETDAINHLKSTLSDINTSITISTGAEALAAGAQILTNSGLNDAFPGYHLAADGQWYWDFNSDGFALSDSIPTGATWGPVLDQKWNIQGDKLCRTFPSSNDPTDFVCVTVYYKNGIYYYSRDGRDGSDNLESWGGTKRVTDQCVPPMIFVSDAIPAAASN